jgi:UDP-N-acetylglucosamine acyltransferase
VKPIHPTSLVDSAAQIDGDVRIGAFAIVEAGVTLEAGVQIEPHAQILTGTRIGAGSIVGRGSVIGGLPQDLAFDPATTSGVVIGCRNTLREHVTINRATRAETNTVVGGHNYLMAGVHVGHDARVGDFNVLANAVLIAGHVEIGSRTVVGGGAVFHQFVRVGDYCMVQGNGSFSKDIPHFMVAMRINRILGLNTVGLRRAGYSPQERTELKALFDLFWGGEKNFSQAVAQARQRTWSEAGEKLLRFFEAPTKKGVCDARDHD